MILKKYTFSSEISAPKILFLGAVHGNEQSGTKAIYKIIEKFASRALTPLKGSVSFIPVCNPLAFEKNTRQINENLNRVIKIWDNPQTYEQQIANELVEHIKDADIIIDLHSSYCPDDKPFVFDDYPNQTTSKIIKSLNIEYIIEGWPDIYKNMPIQDFSTVQCANYFNKSALTVECGWHLSPSSEQVAYYTVLSTLLSLGIVEGYPAKPILQKHIILDKFFIKQSSGNLSKQYKHLDNISKGEIIANYDNGDTICSPQDGFIILPNHSAEINNEWFYLGHLL